MRAKSRPTVNASMVRLTMAKINQDVAVFLTVETIVVASEVVLQMLLQKMKRRGQSANQGSRRLKMPKILKINLLQT